MDSVLPKPVEALLQADHPEAAEAAWDAFLEEYGQLILHVARSLGGDHDVALDRYSFVLERLRRDDFARIRRYAADGRARFTTWLVVVIRRLCVDEMRRRYGRAPGRAGGPSISGLQRRDLVDLIGSEVAGAEIPDDAERGPEAVLRRSELRALLEEALSELDPGDRLLLRLRFEDDVSVPEAARRLGMPTPFHGYRQLNRVLARLRLQLRRAGVDDANP